MATTTTRILNFAAGPAVLPLPVLEEAQRDLIALPGVGMSVLEISHRSKTFEDVIQSCEADIRTLASIPDNYHVLFLQGGASLQFSMVPMNLLPSGGSADYIVTGSWSQKAVKEAKRVATVNIAATTESENFNRIPRQDEIKLTQGAAYVHYTTNNTIFGTEFHYVPEVGRVPLNALEGFVRQVMGWREFVRLVYRTHGRVQRKKNFWGFTHGIPAAFYDGSTGVEPVDHVIRQVLRTGYCHHIERLMILGNFMLLCELSPDAVYRWFMEMFIDSYDWVMVPNVYGMSQFADGGLMSTKPYISGSSYVLKMSDFKKGSWCAVWDALYWRFVDRHADFLAKNPRMAMMVKMRLKLGDRLEHHLRVADSFLAQLHG